MAQKSKWSDEIPQGPQEGDLVERIDKSRTKGTVRDLFIKNKKAYVEWGDRLEPPESMELAKDLALVKSASEVKNGK